MRIFVHTTILLFFTGVLWPLHLTAGVPESCKSDSTTKDSSRVTAEYIPLAEVHHYVSRSRFETAHIMVGIGIMGSRFSDLRKLGVSGSNISVPLSFFVYFPVFKESPVVYFTGGFETSIGEFANGENWTFKGLVMFQVKRLLIGGGAGRTEYKHREENLRIVANQTYGVAAVGINLSPHRFDLLLTIPVTKGLTTTFEENKYNIRPAGIQVSLLYSLR